MQLDTAVKNLTNHGFAVRVFKTQQEAVSAISQELSGRTIGFGGSITLQELGLFETLSRTNTVFWHWKQTPAEACEKAASAQVYMTSANAISETGEIINIDGTGNRVAAMLYGHEALYIIAGTNKLAPDLPSAMERARNIAAPLNARRLSCKTPCAMSEPMRCHDCNKPQPYLQRLCYARAPLRRHRQNTRHPDRGKFGLLTKNRVHRVLQCARFLFDLHHSS